MMRTYSFYHRETGAVHRSVFSTDDARPQALAMNTPEGHEPIEGALHHLVHRVDPKTKAVTETTPQSTDPEREWDPQARKFRLTEAAFAARARARALEAQQHELVRRAVLGDAGALEQLRALDAQLGQQRVAPSSAGLPQSP